MITVSKGAEPKEWLEYRKTPGASYSAIPELREALLKDQGYICAYCMRRISFDDSRIEHVVPQNRLTRLEAMDYRNMVICCNGVVDGCTDRKHQHCDVRKSEQILGFNPFNPAIEATVSYTRDGKIDSTDPTVNHDFNEILNLNLDLLKRNRKEVRDAVTSILVKEGVNRANLNRILALYSQNDKNGMRREYCGVVIDYVKKKLQRI